MTNLKNTRFYCADRGFNLTLQRSGHHFILSFPADPSAVDDPRGIRFVCTSFEDAEMSTREYHACSGAQGSLVRLITNNRSKPNTKQPNTKRSKNA